MPSNRQRTSRIRRSRSEYRLTLTKFSEFFLKHGRVVDPDPGSGSVLDPYSIGSVDPDPDPYSESGSGSRRAKMTHKSRKKLVKVHGFEVLDGLF
jgi:hypothetical protein